MATEIEISLQFSRDGAPATDIPALTPGFPKIRIWDVTDGTNSVVIGYTVMNPVIDGADNDGFYKYRFTNGNGFDETKRYSVAFDAGSSITNDYERYSSGQIVPTDDVINGKLDSIETKVDTAITDIGTVDGKVDSIETKVDVIDGEIGDIATLLDYLRKFESNRTFIDVNNHELLVFDDDCNTVMWKFKLLDHLGAPSVDEIAERVPIAGGTITGPWPKCTV